RSYLLECGTPSTPLTPKTGHLERDLSGPTIFTFSLKGVYKARERIHSEAIPPLINTFRPYPMSESQWYQGIQSQLSWWRQGRMTLRSETGQGIYIKVKAWVAFGRRRIKDFAHMSECQ
ncbi:hypothetical protein L195_g041525, partial [Trifolium pratense]